MKSVSLNGLWKLKGKSLNPPIEISINATVPGCVALDLAEAGYIPKDLYMGENIKETERYENYEWWYEREFDAPLEKENVYLVFDGVDTLADYYINGTLIGKSENMLIPHEFNVSDFLTEEKNKLTVHIKSTAIANQNADHTIRSLMTWGNANETALRRAPHTYGWDIMPRMILPGIFRDVRIEIRDTISFSQMFFRTTESKCEVLYEIKAPFEYMDNIEVLFKGNCRDSYFENRYYTFGKNTGREKLNIKNPKAWWPRGYGEANVYDVTAQIYRNGELVHEKSASFGLRSVKLERSEVTDGNCGCFRFLINGTEIMCKGSNWVPLDAFHSNDKSRYEKALSLVDDIGCNILRCWGGNVYEEDEFFDFCDRNGIMVWQDFAMACRIYPETENFKTLLYREAETVIRRLRNHPSIILWAGDNEVDEMASHDFDPGENSLTREVLPKAVRLNDIGRPYLPSSPYFSKEAYLGKEKGLVPPELHLWGPRDYFKSEYYSNSKAHFISETGYHGCPSLNSIKKFITKDKVWPYQNNSEWIFHSSDQRGNDARVRLMENQIKQLFGFIPQTPEEYIIASQISQAEADKYFIERMRAQRPRTSGIIWWNLLDGWPQMSDAVVDYYFEKKLAYNYIKVSQAPFAIVAHEIQSFHLNIYACNDTLEYKTGSFKITDAEDGNVILEKNFTATENKTTLIARIPFYYSDKKILIIEWCENERSGRNHYLLGYPPFDLSKYITLMKKHGFIV